jgi:hypothetical protein
VKPASGELSSTHASCLEINQNERPAPVAEC